MCRDDFSQVNSTQIDACEKSKMQLKKRTALHKMTFTITLSS